MMTFDAIKGALIALTAQGSITITIPEEIDKHLNLGQVEITIQKPADKVNRETAPAEVAPKAATGDAETKETPADIKQETAPAEEQGATAPAEVASEPAPAEATGTDKPVRQTGYTGLWYDHSGRSAIRIDECGKGLCGKIAWLKNSDHISVCGTDIIGGVQKVGNAYDNGWIYDIERGRKFDVELKLLNDSQLRVKGYAGTKWLSKTMIWKRAPSDLTLCS